MEIEHAALPGIVSASNDVESDDFRSSAVAGIPGSVGFVHAQTHITRAPTARKARAGLPIEAYEDLNATIGSTREARRAGTSAATSATAISNTAMAT